MPLILGTNSIKDTGHDVDNSCRFNNDSSDNLSRTPSSSSNRRTFTFSTWFKLSGTDGTLISAGTDISNGPLFIIDILSGGNEGILRVEDSISGDNVIGLRTTRLLRDVSAWMHLCVAIDTTQGTASDRVKVYINGTQETSFGTETYCDQNLELSMNQNHITRIGTRATSPSGKYFDGYMAETVLIDGSALAPTSFGEFDANTPNVWKPIDVSGLTFGTNGFYLDYKDSSALGNDVSGNNNDFTANNLTAVDQSTDTCTNNFATLNPLNAASGGTFTLSEGNLRVKGADTIEGYTSSTIGFSQGKWYFECESNFNTQGVVGITFDGDSGQVADDVRSDRYPGNATYSYGYIFSSGNKITNSSGSSYGNSLATGDILGVAIDLDNMKLYFSKNGTFQNSGVPTSGSTGTGAIDLTGSNSTGFCFVTVGDNNNAGYGQIDFNFGSPFFSISSGNADGNGYGNFEYSVPSGYFSLCTKNLAEFGWWLIQL